MTTDQHPARIARAQAWLCRLGWHRWKPVMRKVVDNPELRGHYWAILDPFCHLPIGSRWFDWQFVNVGHKCTRCGKRRSV